MDYPYTDELMRWDEAGQRYILEEKALEAQGVFLRDRLVRGRTPSPERIINGFLERVSALIYGYIYRYAGVASQPDELIKRVPSARRVIYRSLSAQALYMALNGDLSMSTDPRDRERAIDEVAAQELLTTLPEIGCSLLYSGTLPRRWYHG